MYSHPNGGMAPKVSLRSVASDCNCQIPVCSEDTDIISVSEEEHEAPVMWVNNGAYCLSHSDQEIVLSRRGWLTDKIIHAPTIYTCLQGEFIHLYMGLFCDNLLLVLPQSRYSL